MLGAEAAHAHFGGLAGFAHRIIAAVKVFALLELLREQVFLVGKFAVETEEALFVGGKSLKVEVRVFGCG